MAGGGIGGLAATFALARQGVPLTVIEQAAAFGEVGAGLQLGPNAVRVLADWGLHDALDAVAAWPEALQVRDAARGATSGACGSVPISPGAMANLTPACTALICMRSCCRPRSRSKVCNGGWPHG